MSTLKVDTIQGKTTAGTVAMPAGMVIQTVSQAITTHTLIQSTSYTATGLTQAITPKFSTSKILVLVNLSSEVYQYGESALDFYFQLTRASSQIAFRRNQIYAKHSSNGYYAISGHGTMIFEDAPNTTSATTYAVNGKLSSTANSATFRVGYTNCDSTLTLQEIAQ